MKYKIRDMTFCDIIPLETVRKEISEAMYILKERFNMKLLSIIVLILSLSVIFVSPLYAELTKKDMEEIRRVIKEEITDLEKNIDKRFEQIDKRFEQIDKRFEQIDKRLEFMQNLMLAMLGVFGGLCGVFVGLLLWNRKIFKEKAKEEAMRELEQKWRINDWITALKEYSQTDARLSEILKKLHLL